MVRRKQNCSRALNFETLDQRVVFASDWQNSVLACDVDHSELVTPLDVLILINSINRDGDRALGPRSSGSTAPYFDVDGDQNLSLVDILRVINVINRSMPELGVTSSLNASADSDANGVVNGDAIQIDGQTGVGSSVQINAVNELGASLLSTTVSANAEGKFSVSVPLSKGLNRVRFAIKDELGRTIERVGQVQRGDLFTDWNASIGNVIRRLGSGTTWTPEQSVAIKPPGVARNLAMLYTAMFDAINAVEGNYRGFAVNLPRQASANATAAGAAAAYRIASSIYADSTSLAIWDATYQASLKDVPNDEARRLGIELGTSVANAVLQSRVNDGAFDVEDKTYSQDPGKWHLATEDPEAILPQWPTVTPFVIPAVANYLPATPPALASTAYAQAVDEVMRIGSKTSATRTADQTNIALFWADGSGTASPPGHWNQITADLLSSRNMTLVDKARMMALLNLAMADAGIVCWDAKYTYEYWRPIDAIRRADVDSNAATTADPAWQPLIKTPAFPSYSSGHSSFSAAASAVLTGLFGNQVSFKSRSDASSAWAMVPTDDVRLVDRSFANFDAAANEAGMSRIYGGIHYSFDNVAGLASGKAVGEYILAHAMLPAV